MNADVDGRASQLLLEEICCDLFRQMHVIEDGASAADVRIDREVDLGSDDRFADIVVTPPGATSYIVEIKIGHTAHDLVHQLKRKYGPVSEIQVQRVIVITRQAMYPDWTGLKTNIEEIFSDGATIEFWDEQDVLDRVKHYWNIDIGAFSIRETTNLRRRLDEINWSVATGEPDSELDSHVLGALPSTLLWHLSPWTLQRLRNDYDVGPEEVLSYGRYQKVAVVMADLCGFSSYVAATRDEDVISHCLTAFYSQSRHAILSNNGFFYQFIGDAVLGLFGLPRRFPNYTGDALQCALALTDIGKSVSQQWQRNIDRLQDTGGLRVGIALGEITMLPLRPYSATHIGFISDSINMAARLGSVIHPGGVLVSNSFYVNLTGQEQALFDEHDTVQAKNVGNIRCWNVRDVAAGRRQLASADY